MYVVLGACAIGACTLDWTLGTVGAADGGLDARADAPNDAPASDGAPSDAGLDQSQGDGCAELVAAARAARANAKRCVINPSYCTTKVRDECGCDVFVALGDAQATSVYASAASAVTSSACRPSDCAACAVLPAVGTCQSTPTLELMCTP